ncbi:MAG: ATP-dependent DNA helicase RecG, partial [Alphaproteobacteria bacterium]|nr:ATP-dependent DNA helicase RecG [Alphaproteobacteria bacterium]
MRPEILFPLFAPVTALPGIGPRLGALVEKLVGPSVVDLLWHLPSGIVDRRLRPKVREAQPGTIATIKIRVDAHQPGRGSRPYRVRCMDDTGFLHLIYFHAKGDYLTKLLPVGAERIVSGRVEHFNNEIQITHPDHVVAPEEEHQLRPIEPVYGLTAGLTPRVLQKATTTALGRAPELPEWLDPAFLKQRAWVPWRSALTAAHAPEGEDDLSPERPARQRLAYDELLANQLALGLVRIRQRHLPGRPLIGDGRLTRGALAA